MSDYHVRKDVVMGNKRQQSSRGNASWGGASRGPVSRGTTPNRNLPTSGVRVQDSQGADDYIAEKWAEEGIDVTKSTIPGEKIAGFYDAQDIMDMPDEERYRIRMEDLPRSPAGKKWAEDRTLVDKDF